MPYFELKKGDTSFPPAYFADIEGLVAVGGDMNQKMLVKAYNHGLYYWHHPMKHVRWWSPDPRLVLELPADPPPAVAHPEYRISGITDPQPLLRHLQSVHNDKDQMQEHWLPERMFRIFMTLHQQGLLYALGIYKENALVGGLFGVIIGQLFFGEYLWAPDDPSARLVLAKATEELYRNKITLIDVQKPTFQVNGMAYDEISRLQYVDRCRANAEANGYKL